MTYQLLYTSRAARPLGDADLAAILMASRDRNADRDITGLLLYGEQHFFQLLEGAEDAVRALFARIRTDRRHEALTVIATRQLDRRGFPGWSMGFRSVGGRDVANLPGFHDLRRLEDLDRLPANDDALFRVMRAMFAANV